MNIGENIGAFFVTLQIEGARALAKLEPTLNKVAKATVGLNIALAGTALAFDRFVSGTVASANQVSDFVLQTELATKSLNEWASVAQKVNQGLNFNLVTQNIENLQKKLTDIQIGRGDIAPFQLLGIDVMGKNAFQVLEQLKTQVKGLDNALATNLIEQLGLDARFLDVLRLTNAEFDELKGNFFLDSKQIAVVTEMGRSINNLKTTLLSLKDQAVAKLAPSVIKLFKEFDNWAKKNAKEIIQVFNDISRAFGSFAVSVGRVLGVLGNLAGALFNTEHGASVLIAAFTFLLGLMRPFLLKWGLIFLILEDIAVWFQGGESAFGGFYDAIAKFIKLFDSFPMIQKALGGAGAVALIATLTGNLNLMSKAITGIGVALGLVGKTLLRNPVFLAIAGVGALAFKAYDLIQNRDIKSTDQAFNAFGKENNLLQNQTTFDTFPTFDELASGSSAPVNTNNITQTNNVENTFQITGQSPVEIANAVRTQMDELTFNEVQLR
jgi:hypothetical protein